MQGKKAFNPAVRRTAPSLPDTPQLPSGKALLIMPEKHFVITMLERTVFFMILTVAACFGKGIWKQGLLKNILCITSGCFVQNSFIRNRRMKAGEIYMEEIELSQTDRQLLLYDIFFRSQQVEYEDITSRLPVGKKMVQRDIKTLTDAGLIRIKYSKKTESIHP